MVQIQNTRRERMNIYRERERERERERGGGERGERHVLYFSIVSTFPTPFPLQRTFNMTSFHSLIYKIFSPTCRVILNIVRVLMC